MVFFLCELVCANAVTRLADFAGFSAITQIVYRLTNEDRLIKAVVTANIYKFCIEELWLRPLSRISIIKEVESDRGSFDSTLLPLGQLQTR